MYITISWDQQPFPEWDSINNRFLEVNETLDQVIIHPNRCDLHSHAACPISVIYRMMRLEATLYHHTRFTSNATSSNPSNHRLTSSTVHYMLAKRSFLLRFHSWYGWRNQCTWPFWKYSVRHSSIQVTQEQDELKAQFLLTEKVLALYSVFDYLYIIWFTRYCRYGVVLRIIIQPVSPYWQRWSKLR